jgi:hypothetical protein
MTFVLENVCAYYKYKIQNQDNYPDFFFYSLIFISFDIKKLKNELGHTFVRNFTWG